MMNRRNALAALFALGAVVRPLGLHAQTAKPARIGWLGYGSRESGAPYIEAFKQGMRSLGYIEGKHYTLEMRFADGKIERLPALAAELVKLPVDIILALTTPPALAAQKATTTIPIVMVAVSDPVGNGLVKSLGRPEGNITGMSNLIADVSPKLVELLLEIVPKLTTAAVMVNAANPAHARIMGQIVAAANKVGLNTVTVRATTADEIDRGFSDAAHEKVGAVILAADALYILHRRQIAELAIKYRLPLISSAIENAEAGGLMGYGESNSDHFRRVATYVDKILKGAKPGDLPVEQPTKFDLVVNLGTSRALGIKIPQSILLRADRVIE